MTERADRIRYSGWAHLGRAALFIVSMVITAAIFSGLLEVGSYGSSVGDKITLFILMLTIDIPIAFVLWDKVVEAQRPEEELTAQELIDELASQEEAPADRARD